MRLGYGINLEQSQKLVMTPELRQAITVLQLSAADLVQYIENAMLENPLLEVRDESEPEEEIGSEPAGDDFTRDWCEYLAEYGQVDRSFDRAWADQEDDDAYNFEHFVAQAPSLHEHLTLQLHLSLSEPWEREIGEFLIGNINDRGYLQISLEEVQKACGYPVSEIERILKVIQSFDPPGVGARDLAECLLIQLEQRGLRTPVMEKLVRFFLGDLARGKLAKIAAALGLTVQEVQLKADLIKSLDPKPGRNFSRPGDVRYIVPDVIVEKVDGEFIVLVNDVSVPRLIINKTYQTLLRQRDTCDPATAQFIENKLKAAVWLIRSIEQRRLTLYRVVKCIVDSQREFLERGIKYLKPLTLKQIARVAELHESTVSRAIANKYIQTPQGVFDLKFFFSSGVENVVAGEMVAAESIKRILKELVENEDATRPYSDQHLCELLRERGIRIARRTVAKYRQEIGIPPVRQRKRYR
ncbi:MAG: RNA polymerase factor sigma-54 [Firmicutes bacterium]|nr:RNA polymerase factor sigma-54 [Bacillota bacterium]